MKHWSMVLLGAAVGGAVGCFAFFWVARQGFYAMVLPGALAGFGACLGRDRSISLCITCGILALALSLLAEWHFEPFIKDASLGYFLTHIHLLRPITVVSIALGTGLGFWLPFSRRNQT
jgi:hypothetical protein